MSVITEPRWATVAEAASEFGVGVSTLYRWIAEDRVRVKRIGPRRLRVDLDSLSEAPTPGLPSPAQLAAALAALKPADLDAVARIARKLLPAVEDSPLAFAHVWGVIGGVARVQAKERRRA